MSIPNRFKTWEATESLLDDLEHHASNAFAQVNDPRIKKYPHVTYLADNITPVPVIANPLEINTDLLIQNLISHDLLSGGGTGTTDHNLLDNLQGGETDNYYHLKDVEMNFLTSGGDATAYHIHDSRYFTEAEITASLLGYALSGHSHLFSAHNQLTGLTANDHPQYALSASLSAYALSASLSAYASTTGLTNLVIPFYSVSALANSPLFLSSDHTKIGFGAPGDYAPANIFDILKSQATEVSIRVSNPYFSAASDSVWSQVLVQTINNNLYLRSYGTTLAGAYDYCGIPLAGWQHILSRGDGGTTNKGLLISTLDANPIVFGTNDIERMRIAGNGAITVTGAITASILATSAVASTFLTHTGGLIQSRTVAQVLTDISAASFTSGTINYLTKFITSAGLVGNTNILDNGTIISAGKAVTINTGASDGMLNLITTRNIATLDSVGIYGNRVSAANNDSIRTIHFSRSTSADDASYAIEQYKVWDITHGAVINGYEWHTMAAAANALAMTLKGKDLTIAGGLGCNGSAAQAAYALGTSASDLPTALVLVNNMRMALLNDGIGKVS